MKKKKAIILYLLSLLLLCVGLFYMGYEALQRRQFGVVDERYLVQIPADELPEDTLYITYKRRLYKRGEMTLMIPAIEVFTPVGESTEPEYLKKMPGLYEFAALPGDENGNISIAGHRDIYDMAFYALDKVQPGDYLYLLYEDMVYRYEYVDTILIKPDDWSVIMPQDFTCLTLTTCDPIGTTLNRLVVRAQLDDISAFDDAYQFAANRADKPQ